MKLSKLKILFFIHCSVFSFYSFSQRTCGTLTPNMEVLQKTNPDRYKKINEIELHNSRFQLQQSNSGSYSSSINGTITIPVIVHVIWNTTAENISLAQIESQINVLNEDFRRMNPDAVNTPTDFIALAADVEIEFVLSQVIRRNTTQTSFSISDSNGNGIIDLSEEQDAGIKFNTHGSAAISTDNYLNIWVCDLAGGLLGYAQFPGGEASTDGVVVTFDSFGRTGTLNPPFDEGRTATHEVGHWLNLNHIWGDDGTSCSGTDNVADTPNQAGPNFGCPSHPSASCSSDDMFMNYMDYSDDACMNMFSQGQKTRMLALFSSGGARESLNCNVLFSNVNFNSNTSIDECDVELSNVNITNGANVDIKASENLIINGTFEAELGTTLSIDND